MKYRIDSQTETVIDLSVFGQPSQEFQIGSTSWVSLTLSDTAGGRIVHLVVDSLRYQGNAPQLGPATADSARGGVLHGVLGLDGRLGNLTATPADNLFLAELQGTIHGFFPKLKTGAKPGEVWSDTVVVNMAAGGTTTETRSLIDYTAAGIETIDGAPAMKLSTQSAVTVSGTAENPQAGTIEIAGTGGANGVHFVGADGRYAGGTSDLQISQSLKMAMAPAPIPMTVKRKLEISRIR